MPLPTVASLCAMLGRHLTPHPEFTAPQIEITAVHISELPNPTMYLTGGELLLTTGMKLPQSPTNMRQYVGGLQSVGISGLVLGLGPVYDKAPEALVSACLRQNLPLLLVPAPTPFLTVTSAYWAARTRAVEQQLAESVAGHRDLVTAAAAPDPTGAILRRLARMIDGWAALLDIRGRVEEMFPVGTEALTPDLEEDIAHLRLAGANSSASFASDYGIVAVFSMAVGNRPIGYLAVCTHQQLTNQQQKVVQTALELLKLDALRAQMGQPVEDVTRRCVAWLVDLGHPEAARSLAASLGLTPLGRDATIMAVRASASEDVRRIISSFCPDALPVMVDRYLTWFLLPTEPADFTTIIETLRSTDESVSVVVSELTPLDAVGAVRAQSLRSLRSLAPGEDQMPSTTTGASINRVLDEFVRQAPQTVQDAVIAYLRHRGRWEAIADDLHIHRNTLRYRVLKARELIGVDLDDPDVAARLWLALRTRGLA